MLIQTTIGHENWDVGGTKVYVFVCPTRDFPLNGKEEHLWALAKASTARRAGYPALASVGSPSPVSAGRGLKPEIVGKWTSAVYDVPDNVLLKLMISRTQSGNSKSINVLISPREGAALRRIQLPTIPTRRSSLSRIEFEGRFDILTLQQAAAMGFTPPSGLMPAFLQSRWSSIPGFAVSEVSPEIVARPIVQTINLRNSEGTVVPVPVVHRRRALDL